MARDEKTKFQQQAELQNRPPLTVDIVTEARKAGRLPVAHSFNMIVGPDETLLAIRSDVHSVCYRVNPEVALNIALELLRVGNQQGWWSIDLQGAQKAPNN